MGNGSIRVAQYASIQNGDMTCIYVSNEFVIVTTPCPLIALQAHSHFHSRLIQLDFVCPIYLLAPPGPEIEAETETETETESQSRSVMKPKVPY